MKYHIEQNGKTACGKAITLRTFAYPVEQFTANYKEPYAGGFACKACAASLTPAAGNTPSYSVRISNSDYKYLIENFGTISNGVREVLNRHREQVERNQLVESKLKELSK